ncbi:MAG: hypothetical protein QW597_01350 [Thermoplasmataceae archaeon]
MNLRKEINKIINLSDSEIAELESNPEESEKLVKELMREYKLYSDLMGKKSRLLVLEKNYEYLAFRAVYEIQNNVKTSKVMISYIEPLDSGKVRGSIETINRLEKTYGNEKTKFQS